MSPKNKLLKRVIYWNLEAFLCFRKKPEESARHTLNPSLTETGWLVRQVNSDDSNDVEMLIPLFQKAYTEYSTKDKATKEVTRALTAGDKCFVLTNEEEFTGMVWLGLEQNHMMTTVGAFIPNRNDSVVEYRVYISPKSRGFGAQKAISSAISQDAFLNKKEWMYCFVGVKNIASLKNCLKTFDELRLVYHLRVELPKLKLNFFPKLRSEDWETTQK